VPPNPACSGHGYDVGQRRRFEGGVAPPTMLLGKHAVPLTRSLGETGFYLGATMNKDTREILEALVENIETLKSLNFEGHIREVGLGFEMYRTSNNDWVIEFSSPDNKELQAFLFKFRLFIQKNEPISLFKLRDLMADPGLSNEWKAKVDKALREFDGYYNAYPEDVVELFNNNAPTHGKILDIFLYGGLAHTGLHPKFKHKRQTYKTWTADDFDALVLKQKFVEVVLEVFRLLVYIGAITHEELRKNKT